MKSIVHNIDCMEFLRTQADKSFDLAIVDPPYGGGAMQELEDDLNGTKLSLSKRKRAVSEVSLTGMT